MAAILELRAVKAFYGQSEVLHGIDVVVEEAGMTVLLGANGAGKTTTLRAICGMVRAATRGRTCIKSPGHSSPGACRRVQRARRR